MAATAYDRQTSFALYSAENPGEAIPGADLDSEFAAVKVALDDTQAFLDQIQRSDGRLANGSVGRDQLDSSLTIGFESPTPWATSTAYSVSTSTVFKDAKFYTCLTSHTSTDFAADLASGYWLEVADLSVAAALEDGAVTTAKLADGAVTAAKVGTSAVTSVKLGTNSVTTVKITDGNVTTDKLAANAVTSGKVDSSVWGTGDVKLTLKNVADAGWRMFDDGTIGDASSGATYANAAAEDLFTLMYDNFVDANCAITTSAGSATTRAAQTNAATAWAAHCRIALPKTLGRALGIAGAGSGLTSRALGVSVGAETHTLTVAEAPSGLFELVDGHHSHTYTAPTGAAGPNAGTPAPSGINSGASTSTVGANISLTDNGGDDAHNNVQPTVFLNAMVKL